MTAMTRFTPPLVATLAATLLLVTGVTGLVSQYTPVPDATAVVAAQFPNPNEPPAPNSCKWEFDQTNHEIDRELSRCNSFCIADEYASCFTMCLGDANAAKDQARADLRDCQRSGR